MASPVGRHESKALQQGHILTGGRSYSPTKPGLIVLPKPAVAPNPCKSRVLPPLAPLEGEPSLSGENSELGAALEVEPRPSLREKIALLAIESKPKRHSVEFLVPQTANEEASIALPPPMLTQAKRNVKRPTPAQL
jgi:hypothetical protein